MKKGLAWIHPCEHDSGKVIVISDDGHKALMPAAHYAIANINPPIYELPQRQKEPANRG
jgi:hypothetical protein